MLLWLQLLDGSLQRLPGGKMLGFGNVMQRPTGKARAHGLRLNLHDGAGGLLIGEVVRFTQARRGVAFAQFGYCVAEKAAVVISAFGVFQIRALAVIGGRPLGVGL